MTFLGRASRGVGLFLLAGMLVISINASATDPCPLPTDPEGLLALVFPIFDTDGDGGLSAAEANRIYPGVGSYISLLDNNHDGVVNPGELAGIISSFSLNPLSMVDANGNRLIEYGEVSSYVSQEQFALLDRNGNGMIDCGDAPGAPVEGESVTEPCPITDLYAAVIQVALKLLDTNNDAGISVAEIAVVYPGIKEYALYFHFVDTNYDDKVDAAELNSILSMLPTLLSAYGGVSIPGGDITGYIDPNHDGVIEYAEVASLVTEEQFGYADLNRDGVVDCRDLAIILQPVEGEPTVEGEVTVEGEPSVEGEVTVEGEYSVEGEPVVVGCPIPDIYGAAIDIALRLLDTNQDGGLSLTEIAVVYPGINTYAAYFGLVDTNHDGKVDASELRQIVTILPMVLGASAGTTTTIDLVGYVDPNHDGVIEYAEVASLITQEQFSYADLNDDGVIDCRDLAIILPPLEGEPVFEGEPNFEGEMTFEGEPYFEGEMTFEGEPSFEGEMTFEGEPVVIGCPLPDVLYALANAVIRLADTDYSGGVSLVEIQALYAGAPESYFAMADFDHDGSVTAKELIGLVNNLPFMTFVAPVRMIDRNGDSIIQYEEVSAYVTPELFAKIDLNSNGVFDCGDLGDDPPPPTEGEITFEGEVATEGEVTVEGEITTEGEPDNQLDGLLDGLRGSADIARLLEKGFALLDTNGDSALSYDEVGGRFHLPRQAFDTVDANADGLVTWDELEALRNQLPQNPGAVIQLVREVAGDFENRFFTPGEVVRVTLRLFKQGSGVLNQLQLLEMLPEGWTIQNLLDAAGVASLLKADSGNVLVLSWNGNATFPMEITYEATPPNTAGGLLTFTGQADYVTDEGVTGTTGVVPSVLAESLPSDETHTADTNADWRISLTEALRVVQLYNAGGYAVAADTEDGYVPGACVAGALPHSSDTNGDWNINLSELLRLVQLYNAGDGAYYVSDKTEDGFVPGIY